MTIRRFICGKKSLTPSRPILPVYTLCLYRFRLLLRKGHNAGMDSPRRVLVVEDFEDLRKLVAYYLDACGYQVLEAANGKAAIQAAVSGNPSIILLDLRLPDLNGSEVARELRKLPQTENIPIIGWSADVGLSPQRKMLRQAGIVDYLEKPTSLKELVAAIDRSLFKER